MSELDIQKRLTHAFILTQPVTLTLTPRTKNKTPAGGVKWANGAARDPQIMRLVEPSRSGDQLRVDQGVARDVEFEIIGEWNSNIGLYDTFTHDGKNWEVSALLHFNGYERRALVVRHGG